MSLDADWCVGLSLTCPRWQASLYNAVSPYQPARETGLVKILPGLLGILGDNMDILPKLLSLLDSYLLLDAPGLLQVSVHHELALEAAN